MYEWNASPVAYKTKGVIHNEIQVLVGPRYGEKSLNAASFLSRIGNYVLKKK